MKHEGGESISRFLSKFKEVNSDPLTILVPSPTSRCQLECIYIQVDVNGTGYDEWEEGAASPHPSRMVLYQRHEKKKVCMGTDRKGFIEAHFEHANISMSMTGCVTSR
jgi:hypothetical protein